MRWTPCRQQLLLPDPPSRSQGPTQRELDELIEFVKRAKRTGTGGLVVATINAGLAAGIDSHIASKIPGDGAPIACNLCLRRKRESGRWQGFSRDEVRGRTPRPCRNAACDKIDQVIVLPSMARLFTSYSRSNQAHTKMLAGDLEDLNHMVWLDVELAGGQIWWDQILQEIRNCDIFVLVMSKASVVDSVACKREYQYSAALQKPILPVLVADDVSTSLLPSELQKIQFVDYKLRDINSIKSLARALGSLPLGHQLPNPLPPAPEPPISYLASLSNQIDRASFLDLEAQSRILIELKSSLRDPATSLDSELLLKRLRARHDLFAKIAEDIDQVLVPAPTARRFLVTPQAVKQKPLVMPLTNAAEREKIAQLRIWVQWLLWATPITAFFSVLQFKQKRLMFLLSFYFFALSFLIAATDQAVPWPVVMLTFFYYLSCFFCGSIFVHRKIMESRQPPSSSTNVKLGA